MHRREFLNDFRLILGAAVLPDVDGLIRKDVYITIDDGPNKYMEEILNLLDRKYPVTFFVMAGYLKDYRKFDLARRAINEGHQIGNHTYSHQHFSDISIKEGISQIERAQELVEKVYDSEWIKCPKFFRYPFRDPGYRIVDGEVQGVPEKKEAIFAYLEKEGYKIIDWDLDLEDWKYHYKKEHKSIPQIINNVQLTKDKNIILMHENEVTTYIALPRYINSSEYRVVPLR